MSLEGVMNTMTIVHGDENLRPVLRTMNVNEDKKNQFFYGRGKLLLSGEYLVLDGARALAVPLKVGQSMTVTYSSSFSPSLTWKSYDQDGNLWLEARFEFWRFNILSADPSPAVLELQKILREARKQNTHFLRDEGDVLVETQLGFPLDWGLGSSSSLIYNMAQWAYVSPFELQFKTLGGSGYDVACAQSEGPIVYTHNSTGPNWSPTLFSPPFEENLYLIYLGKKQNSRDAVAFYQNQKHLVTPELIQKISAITETFLTTLDQKIFEQAMEEHEEIIGKLLNAQPLKEKHFSDFWGAVKSLGAWGGDFALVSSTKSRTETEDYFREKGFPVFMPFSELVLSPKSIGGALKDELVH